MQLNIENILRIDAENAREGYDIAFTLFLELCSVHARTPRSPEEIEKGSQHLQFAREAQTVTTQRLNDFILHGTVPEILNVHAPDQSERRVAA